MSIKMIEFKSLRAKPPRPVRLMSWAMAVIAMSISTAPALAHSLEELGTELLRDEEYFQPVDQPAPDFLLIDAGGKEVRMTDLRGKVVILNFIYASCGDVCPLHSVVIAYLQRMVNQSPMEEQVAFVSVTTDPENDRGAVLADYGTTHGLDPVNWMFLTSPADQPEDTTRQLARAYGLEFTETEDGAQMHGLVTNVIDRDGNLRGRFHGLRFDPVRVVVFANALVNDHHGPGEQAEKPNDFWSWIGSFVAPQEGVQP